MLKLQVFSGKGPVFSLLWQQCRRGKQNHSGEKCFESPIGKPKYSTLQGTTYPTLGKGKSSSKVSWEGDMLVARRVDLRASKKVDDKIQMVSENCMYTIEKIAA